VGAKVRDIRQRIRSTRSTQQITRATELIATSRIMKAQGRATRARPYAQAINEMIEMVSGAARNAPLLAAREVRHTAIIALTSDRGLAGAFNSNVLREAERARRREIEAGHEVRFSAIGRKAVTYFSFRQIPMAQRFTGISDAPTFAQAQEVAEPIIDGFSSGEVDKVLLVYTEFVSSFLQRVHVTQVLPVQRSEAAPETAPGEPHAMFDFEPEPAELLEALLPRYVEVTVYTAMLESTASFYAAQRRAMKSATDNAEELLKVLGRDANRARQAEITSELADIVGATEALRGKV
jgi:F-type H+-transporting ATPase subunit gamma